jgi:hypothetical protein
MRGFPARRGTFPRVDEPGTKPTQPRELFSRRTVGFLLLHVAAPLVFAVAYVAFTDMTFTVVNFLAASLTVVLLVGSYTLPSSSIRRSGRLRGLLSASIIGAAVGALLGLLGTGIPPRGSEEATAFASWLLVGLCAPAFSWFAVRTFSALARLPRNVWSLLTRLIRSRSTSDHQRPTGSHPASGRGAHSGRTTDPSGRKQAGRARPKRKKRAKPRRKKR